MLRKSPSGLTYLADWESASVNQRMEHLACFAGGMFALGASVVPQESESDMALAAAHMKIGTALTETCFQSYNRSATQLGPDSFHFDRESKREATGQDEEWYFLR